MKRVVVIGSGGSGKSTFSRTLGEITGLHVIHLDRLYWRPNWEKTPADEWEATVQRLTEHDEWIMDGNFGGTREMRMKAADTIIMLDLPRWLCMYRILKRSLIYKNGTRPDMAEGCEERLDWEFIMWVWNYRQRSRARALTEIDKLREKQIIIFRNRRQIKQFLNGLRSRDN